MVTPNDASGSSSDQVWALIPARSGSKAVKDKNLQTIDGHSILAWSVMAAVAAAQIDRVFVSTDSREYMHEASLYGAETPFQRPAELATDSSSDFDVIRHFLDWAIGAGEGSPAAIVHLRPTTPMRDPVIIDKAIALALTKRGCASAVRSVHEASESPFKWFLMEASGFLTTLQGERQLDAANAARQTFPKVFVPNGYVDVIYPEVVLQQLRIHGDAVMAFETGPVVEVDTMSDLELIRAIWRTPDTLSDVAESSWNSRTQSGKRS